MTTISACRHECRGGARCGCNGSVPHELHICRNPHCPCHDARDGYGLELAHGKRGDVYVPAGALLVERKGAGK